MVYKQKYWYIRSNNNHSDDSLCQHTRFTTHVAIYSTPKDVG